MAAVLAVACSGGQSTPQDQSVAPVNVALAIAVTGDGAVHASGIDCKAACTQRLPKGTHLILEALPNAGATFSGWGAACAGVGRCDLTLDADKSITAVFTTPPPPAKARLTVLTDGHGSVQSAPAGIDCGATCMAAFDAGTLVSLTAVAEVGRRFAGWSGACGGQGTCSVTMSGDIQLSARFEALPPPPPENRHLTVTISGPGAVRSTPAGIDCGPLCGATYTAGTSVTLVAAGVLRSAPKRPDGAVRIFPGQNNDGAAGNIDSNGSVVYWTVNYYYGYSWQQPNGIWRANADGSDRRQIPTTSEYYFRSVCVDDAHIFYVGDSKLVRRLK